MDAMRHETNDVDRGRRNRVVLAPRRWRSSSRRRFKRLAGDGGKKARSPGRSRISRNTIAQGMPVVAGEPVVANACAFCCTRGRGSIGHPAFPAPSSSNEGGLSGQLGRNRAARTRMLVSPAITSPQTSRPLLDGQLLAVTQYRYITPQNRLLAASR
jgi:hypothetical protein